jgi:glycosyltransferase involved in cell wall biosynthesis
LIERRNFYVEKFPIKVIHNGVEIGSPLPNDVSYPSGWLRSKLNILEPEAFIVGMIGRIERYKGHEDLIIASSMLPESCLRPLKIIFIGSGDNLEIQRLQLLAEKLGVAKNITFFGYFNEDIRFIIQELNLLAMLTKDFEGFGLTIAESMSSGIPVVASNVGAVSEFFSEKSGFLVEPESPSMICSVLQKAMLEPLALKMKAQRAALDIQEFNVKYMARDFHRIIYYGA